MLRLRRLRRDVNGRNLPNQAIPDAVGDSANQRFDDEVLHI